MKEKIAKSFINAIGVIGSMATVIGLLERGETGTLVKSCYLVAIAYWIWIFFSIYEKRRAKASDAPKELTGWLTTLTLTPGATVYFIFRWSDRSVRVDVEHNGELTSQSIIMTGYGAFLSYATQNGLMSNVRILREEETNEQANFTNATDDGVAALVSASCALGFVGTITKKCSRLAAKLKDG